ncbi:MAG: AsmA family protein [Desulfuromonadales bacterium]|nr:AsmA family protein [Desulfuromonadales bacterium]
MSTFAKFAVALVGILLLLLISLIVLIKVVVTPEKVRETLLPFAEETLQRKIEVGDIEIGLLSGISLKDLKVMHKDQAAEFVSIKSLALHYRLLALLSGSLVVDQILLEQPRIVVIRNQDGQFNFSDLIAGDAEKTQQVSEKKAQTNSAESVLDLLIKEVTVAGGEIIFVDRLQSAKSPYRYELKKLNFNARKITLNDAFPIDFSAELNGSQIKVAGHYDIAKQRGDLDIMLTVLDLVKFAPYYRQELPGKLGSALLSLDTDLQFQAQQLSATGKLQLNNLDLLLNDFPEAALREAKLAVDYAISFDMEQKVLDLSTLLVNFNEIKLGTEGSVNLAGKEPQLVLALLLDKLDLRTLVQGLPAGLTKDLRPYSLAGQLDGRVELSGQPSHGPKLLRSAKLNLFDVQASVDSLRTGISGELNYADQQVTAEKMLLTLAGQQAQLSFKATNLLGDIIRGHFQITADTLDVNRLLPAGTQEAKSANGEKSTLPQVERKKTLADEIGPFNIPAEMTGSLQVNKLLYKKLNLEQVRADLELKNNHLKINELRSGVGGGEFRAMADIDLGVKGLSYQGQMTLDQSNLVSLVSGLIPQAKQSVSGLLQWQNNFSGRGTLPDNLLQNLQLKGVMQVQQGEISGSPLLEQLSVFLGSSDLKVLSFQSLESRYDLRDGLARLTGSLDGSKAKLKPEGTIGVDGALNMSLNARLAPELMQKLGARDELKQAMTDKDGWGIFPLKISGSLTRPKIGFDSKALQKQATRKIKEEAAKRLLKEIVPKDEGAAAPIKQLLNGALNRLFGN